jgi:hypothetical protein
MLAMTTYMERTGRRAGSLCHPRAGLVRVFVQLTNLNAEDGGEVACDICRQTIIVEETAVGDAVGDAVGAYCSDVKCRFDVCNECLRVVPLIWRARIPCPCVGEPFGGPDLFPHGIVRADSEQGTESTEDVSSQKDAKLVPDLLFEEMAIALVVTHGTRNNKKRVFGTFGCVSFGSSTLRQSNQLPQQLP